MKSSKIYVANAILNFSKSNKVGISQKFMLQHFDNLMWFLPRWQLGVQS